MTRDGFIDLLKRISFSKFQTQNDLNVSKSLGFYFLKRFIDTEHTEDDYWNSNVDASNDRGFDFIFFDDSSESLVKIIFIQCKYSEDGATTIDENEVAKTINNFNSFPNIQGNKNSKLEEKLNDYKILAQKEDIQIEKQGIYINLGLFAPNAKEALERSQFEIYDFSRFNSEILLDEDLPEINITLKKPALYYDDNNFIGILSLEEFLNDSDTRDLIKNQKLFHYNVRGLMRNKKNSIADDIKNTATTTPDKLFQRNNGLTIICQSFSKTDQDDLHYALKQASIINGQQTIRALLSTWGNLKDNEKSKLALTVKILGIKISDSITEILNVAKASNKQNAIKESDLFANEPEQKNIEEKSQLLPDPIKYTYLPKRTVQFPEDINVITRDEATLLLSLFINQNPSDRLEGLYKTHYKSIFENIKPEYIPIIKIIKKKIEERYNFQDTNNPTEKFWSEKAYKKFKKSITLNFSIYLLSIVLSDSRFGYEDKQSRKRLLDSIYEKMKTTSNYDINSYFNYEFWLALQNACLRYIRIKHSDPNTTSDELRKEVNKEDFMMQYNNYCTDKASEGEFKPSITL